MNDSIKTFNCPTVSGKSQLTYAIGKDDAGDIHFSITSNSGGGFFSAEWVAWKDIHASLEKKPGNHFHPALTTVPGEVSKHTGFSIGCTETSKDGSVIERTQPEVSLGRSKSISGKS